VRGAFEAGAHAYLCKTSAPEEIETAVREVLKGRFYVSPEVTQGLVGGMQEPLVERRESQPEVAGEVLTPRELDIVRLVGKGLGNKKIAHELGVSVTTVRTRRVPVGGRRRRRVRARRGPPQKSRRRWGEPGGREVPGDSSVLPPWM
jgi:DNA-binding NarL/FixJ family response regulator